MLSRNCCPRFISCLEVGNEIILLCIGNVMFLNGKRKRCGFRIRIRPENEEMENEAVKLN